MEVRSMSRLVEALPEREQAAAAAALAACPTVAVPAGSSRTRARLPESALLVVEDGVVMVTSLRPGATRRMIVAVAGPGAVLLTPGPDERLEALADTTLTCVSPEAHGELLALPGAAAAVFDALT